MRSFMNSLISSKQVSLKALILTVLISLLVFSLALAASGDLDPTFSGDGKLTTNFGGTLNDNARAMAIQSNGKIVVAGTRSQGDVIPPTSSDFAVARYNSNGTLDTTFSGDGRLTTHFGGLEEALGIAIQGDGRIVVVGQKCSSPDWICDVAIARYNTNGSLDPTFSGDGRQITDYGGGDNGSYGGVAIQTNGKIVVAGRMHNGSNYNFAVYRYNANGSLDTTFSGDGGTSTGFAAGWDDDTFGLVLQPDGKIVVAGRTCTGGWWGSCNFALARYHSNGSLDLTFSGDGRQTTNFGGLDYVNAVARQADGKIVAAGRMENAGVCSLALARYTINGALDTTFSFDGITTTPLSSTDCAWWHFLGTKIQSDGKIFVAASKGLNGNHDFLLVRYKSNGIRDLTFSGDGAVFVSFGGDDLADAVAIQPNGRIVIAGWTNFYGDTDFALAGVIP